MRRYALRDDQCDRIKDFLAGREGHVGDTATDNRLFVDAVLYRYRVGRNSTPGSSWGTMRLPSSACGGRSAPKSSRRTSRTTSLSSSGSSPNRSYYKQTSPRDRCGPHSAHATSSTSSSLITSAKVIAPSRGMPRV